MPCSVQLKRTMNVAILPPPKKLLGTATLGSAGGCCLARDVASLGVSAASSNARPVNSDARLARHRGRCSLEASSGRVQRHRLDRGGNRQLSAALYRIAITQARFRGSCARLSRTQTRKGQEST